MKKRTKKPKKQESSEYTLIVSPIEYKDIYTSMFAFEAYHLECNCEGGHIYYHEFNPDFDKEYDLSQIAEYDRYDAEHIDDILKTYGWYQYE